MKNIFVLILGFLMVSMLFAGTNVWAGAQDLSGSGTILDSDTNGPGIAVTLSPNVSISYNGISTEFEICGFNTKGAIEYGLSSGTAGVWMHPETALTTLTTHDGSTVDDWLQMGSTSS